MSDAAATYGGRSGGGGGGGCGIDDGYLSEGGAIYAKR